MAIKPFITLKRQFLLQNEQSLMLCDPLIQCLNCTSNCHNPLCLCVFMYVGLQDTNYINSCFALHASLLTRIHQRWWTGRCFLACYTLSWRFFHLKCFLILTPPPILVFAFFLNPFFQILFLNISSSFHQLLPCSFLIMVLFLLLFFKETNWTLVEFHLDWEHFLILIILESLKVPT